MKRTLVLGIGNLLLSDDGLGVHAIQRLIQSSRLPEEIQILDGGTSGLDLLPYLEGIERLVIVDAIKMNQPAGTLIRLEDEQIPAYLAVKVSPHDIAVPDLLLAAKLIDVYPPKVVVLGLQPEKLELGTELSPAIASQMELLLEKIIEEVCSA